MIVIAFCYPSDRIILLANFEHSSKKAIEESDYKHIMKILREKKP